MSVPRGALAVLLAIPLLVVTALPAAADTIPHENFDQAQLDLAVLKLLLDNSLLLATESMLSCVDDDAVMAVAYSDSLAASVAAPTALIQDLSDSVESYEFLLEFVPPFSALSTDDSSLTGTYTTFLENFTELRALANAGLLAPEDYDHAMDLLAQAVSYVAVLLNMLDTLDTDADGIDALPEIPEQGDLDVQPLRDAIQLLRDKLAAIETELAELAKIILDPTPRLILRASADRLYLGETLVLSGYLFQLGGFVPDVIVDITKDGAPLATVDTGPTGRYWQTFYVPIEPGSLGTYAYHSTAVYESATYGSDTVDVTFLRIPTSIAISPEDAYALGSVVRIDGALVDYRSAGLDRQTVTMTLDYTVYQLDTGADGGFSAEFATSGMDYGQHSVSARYAGNATHAPSETPAYTFVLEYAAVLTLELSNTTVKLGAGLWANGTFSDEHGTGIEGVAVNIVLDGERYAVVETGPDGNFTVEIDTLKIGPGTHTVFAEHNGTDTIWLYTQSPELSFDVLADHEGGWIPGIIVNPGDLIDQIKDLLRDLFFGQYALLAWALLILLIVAAYLVYRWHRKRAVARLELDEQQRKAVMYEARIVRPTMVAVDTPFRTTRKLTETTLWRLIDSFLGSMSPRDAVVHGYGGFLKFLGKERDTSLDPSLTHLEIHTELVFMGYPRQTVGAVTDIYEKAMYTEKDVSIEDALGFADALAVLETYGKVMPE